MTQESDKPLPTEDDTAILECVVGPDDIIYLTIGGSVTGEHIEAFKAWGEKVKAAMVMLSKKNPDRVLTLIDVSKLDAFDLATSGELYGLMKFNKNYATRTAVYGANYFAQVTTEAIIGLTHRTNMKIFSTREEAMGWLLKGGENGINATA